MVGKLSESDTLGLSQSDTLMDNQMSILKPMLDVLQPAPLADNEGISHKPNPPWQCNPNQGPPILQGDQKVCKNKLQFSVVTTHDKKETLHNPSPPVQSSSTSLWRSMTLVLNRAGSLSQSSAASPFKGDELRQKLAEVLEEGRVKTGDGWVHTCWAPRAATAGSAGPSGCCRRRSTCP